MQAEEKTADPRGELDPRWERIRAARQRALQALLQRQHPDGHFSDYDLPLGRSDAWITAYVGRALVEVEEALDGSTLHAAAHRGADHAAAWLAARGPEAWGFNGVAGRDADTTAHAVLLLLDCGRSVPAAALSWLVARYRPDEGFATFDRDDAWGRGHLCITGPVALALARGGQLPDRRALIELVQRRQTPEGTWPAYWWRSSHYAEFTLREMLSAFGAEQRWPAERACRFQTAFELACLTGIEAGRGDGSVALELADALLAWQGGDGRLQAGADLRVTEPDCDEPWEDARGRCYIDTEGLLTTATACRALRKALLRARDGCDGLAKDPARGWVRWGA